MSTRYTPCPGEFFEVYEWRSKTQGQMCCDGDPLLLIKWDGPFLDVYSPFTGLNTFRLDARDVGIDPLSDEEVVRRLGGHKEVKRLDEEPELRYIPSPGEFFTSAGWWGHIPRGVSVGQVLLLIKREGTFLVAWKCLKDFIETVAFDDRNADLSPLSDEEVLLETERSPDMLRACCKGAAGVTKINTHNETATHLEPLNVIGEFCVALAEFTAKLTTLSEALKKAGKEK